MKGDGGYVPRNVRYVDYIGLSPPGGMCGKIGGGAFGCWLIPMVHSYIYRTPCEYCHGVGVWISSSRAWSVFSKRLLYFFYGSRMVLIFVGEFVFKIYNGRYALFNGLLNMREEEFLVYFPIVYGQLIPRRYFASRL